VIRAIACLYGIAQASALNGAPTQIHYEPLASAATSVPPNLMFILDDSGSMLRAFTPDYVKQNTRLCRDASDNGVELDECDHGDPSYSSPQFNFQWYNPAITYTPGYDPSLAAPAPGTDWNMTSYDTPARWAAVENDPYPSNNPSGSTNILVGNSDIVYCNTNSPGTAGLFNTAVCKEPIDHSITPPAEAAGTGVWRYPDPPRNDNNGLYSRQFTRTGTATNPVRPYFYTISQVTFCVNRNTNTPNSGSASYSKLNFGKGTTDPAELTNRCHVRRFNDGSINYQWPRFGRVPYSSTADTAALNVQSGTDNANNRWAGVSGFRKHVIVETVAGNNTLPDGYPSKSDAAVYSKRSDCGGGACNYTQEMTNYANWYAYYRTRILTMKTAAGKAFFKLDEKFRVGFITINPGDPVSSNQYLPLRTFDASHKADWYTKFYGQSISAFAGTPLREALSRVGRHFAGKTDRINDDMDFAADSLNPQGNPDSMIASCQQNFALLTTDGYWTTATSAYDGNANTGWEVDGATRMGDHDNDSALTPPPFYDGPNVQNTTAARSIGTLADVAMYYYKNDLRPQVLVAGKDIWANNVPQTEKDNAPHQHMTTFTLGLGLEGILGYQANYDSNPPPPGDYAQIADGSMNWPIPDSNGDDEKALDDLWHAAVNGRGKFFSARDPNSLSESLSEALTRMNSVVGAGAAAATSNLQPVAGDQWAFTAEYQTVGWHGDVKARTIDLGTGEVSKVHIWSAREKLDATTPSSRNILTYTTDTGNFPTRLKPFTWTGVGSTYPTDTPLTPAEQAYFNPSQLALSNGWNSGQAAAATAKSLVEFLRGDTSKEDSGTGAPTDLYRVREHILGDIVSAQPVYIKSPPFGYTDNGYLAYRTANLGRRGTVYVAANDGMLHAFETDPDGSPRVQTEGIGSPEVSDDEYTGTNDGGGERWAFIPSRVLRNMYRLAERDYTHRWYVDGTPIVEDICLTVTTGSGSLTSPEFTCPNASAWRAILVGGLNGGGRGYYALDVSDPLNPKALWEFNARDPSVTACAPTPADAVGATDDCDLGLSFGNPIMAKLPLGNANSGKWVAIVSSGYNNIPGVDGTATTTGGDGNGYLYVLDALTGRIIEKIQTCTGSTTTPCNFVKLNSYHPLQNEKVDNSPVRIYGTDILGGVWRIDLTQQLTPRVHLVASLKDPAGVAQPITTPPELYLPAGLDTISYSDPWLAPAAVFVGTGRYLGTADRASVQKQSLYAIKDIPGVTATLANARTGLQSRTFTAEANTTVEGQTVIARSMTDCSSDPFTASNGWYADFPPNAAGVANGERVNVDSRIVATTWVVASNIPEVNSCTAGGSSWLNFVDVNRGCAVQGTTYTSVKFSSSLIVGVSPIQIGDKIKTIVTTADNQQITTATPIGGGEFEGRRVQWRELLQGQ
jgi:type IV pilus assembly protein PilY1